MTREKTLNKSGHGFVCSLDRGRPYMCYVALIPNAVSIASLLIRIYELVNVKACSSHARRTEEAPVLVDGSILVALLI